MKAKPNISSIDFTERPFIVIWETTRACQLACKHCRAEAQPHADPRQLNHDEALHLIDQIMAFGDPLPNLVLTGGDPLERPDLFDLIRYAVRKGLRVSITPSATPKVTKEAMEKAKKAGLSRWAFSLDGSTAAIHDSFRGWNGSYELTIRSISYLHELGLPIQINTTISRYNIHDLDNIAALLQKLGVVLWSVFFLVPTGRGNIKDMISPTDHERVFNWLYDLSQKAPFDIKTTAAQHFRRVALQRRTADRRAGKDTALTLLGTRMAGRATADGVGRAPLGVNDGNGFIFISHTGDVYPSGFLPVTCGNIRQQSLAEIYRNSPILKDLRNPDKLKGKCGWCEFRFICGGSRARAYAVTGDYLESEPFCTYIPDPRHSSRWHNSGVESELRRSPAARAVTRPAQTLRPLPAGTRP